jgi:hypothetical protein
MRALAIFLFFAPLWVPMAKAEDAQREVAPATESPRTEADEPALPSAERSPVDSSPSLLPESNELPEHVPVEHSNSRKAVASPARGDIEKKQRFERIRLQAMNNPHAVYLLNRANHALKSATRRSYMRAYCVNVAERMRKLDPELKSSIDAYEEAGMKEAGGNLTTKHSSFHRTVRRMATRKARYANHHSHSHHYYQRAMVIDDPYGPDYPPYGPPVVLYPW